jgi:hypothetical protein
VRKRYEIKTEIGFAGSCHRIDLALKKARILVFAGFKNVQIIDTKKGQHVAVDEIETLYSENGET